MGRGGRNKSDEKIETDPKSYSIDSKLDKLLNKMDAESKKADDRHADLSSDIRKVHEKVIKIEKRVSHVEFNNKIMNEELHRLKITVNSLQQSMYKEELVIRGVPEVETNDDELFYVVQQIVKSVKCVPEPTICKVHRFGKKINNVNNSHRTILVQFGHLTESYNLLAKKKQIKLTCDQIKREDDTPVGPATQLIYFDERLTKATNDLFRTARIMRKQMKLKAAWIKKGKLFVRKQDGDNAVRILTQEQLEQLDRKRKLNSTPVDPADDVIMETSSIVNENDDDYSERDSTVKPSTKKLRSGNTEQRGG